MATVVGPPRVGRGRGEGLRAEVGQRLSSAPGRLRAVGGLLVVLMVAFGALTAVQVSQRSTAAENVRTHSQPLSNDAAEIFRSLADADTTAATGFLQAGSESQAVRARYNSDVQRASALLAQAAARTSADDPGQQWITKLNQQLPSYTSLVSTAGSYNRVGYPLGGAYLRFASANMQQDGGMLTQARALYDAETARLHRDYADAKSFPWAAIGLGLVALAVLAWTQLRLFRRTNRVFNPGLVTATLLTLAGLLWLTAGQTLATLSSPTRTPTARRRCRSSTPPGSPPSSAGARRTSTWWPAAPPPTTRTAGRRSCSRPCPPTCPRPAARPAATPPRRRT
ncbi:hypothetical protein ACFQZC_25930 [Streptacidiphilus monticola]